MNKSLKLPLPTPHANHIPEVMTKISKVIKNEKHYRHGGLSQMHVTDPFGFSQTQWSLADDGELLWPTSLVDSAAPLSGNAIPPEGDGHSLLHLAAGIHLADSSRTL